MTLQPPSHRAAVADTNTELGLDEKRELLAVASEIMSSALPP